MKHSLLIYGGLLVAGLLGSQSLHAQGVVAGQTAGTTYVDITDKNLGAATSGPRIQSDSLDLDADGRFDLRFTAYASATNFPSEVEARVLPLHDNVAIYSGSQSPVIVGFALNDSIKQRIAQPSPTLPPNVWGSRSSIYAYGPSYLTHQGNNPAGIQSYGNWLDAKDRYMGVRLRSSAATGWRYGWVRLQVNSYTNAVLFSVKDYAISTTVLAVQAAQTAGWQVYPTQVTDQLTLEPPTPTGQSQVTVADLCGRAVAQAVVSGRCQQLSLAGLAPGVYFVQLDTPAGHFVQRIVKQ